MSDTLEFKGTWNPSLGAFPVITDDTTACYYLVSDAGYVDGYTFNQGDWLIYVEEPISPTETHGRWFRSEGGMVQVAPLQESPTPSYSFDEPGTYTKLTVNNAGVVVAGDFLTGTDIPTHSQDASTIQNLTPAARSAVGPMFVNTARSKAVDFEYDSDTNTVAADVKIDGVSIVKDEFGQLKVADSITSATGSVDVDGDQLFPPEEHTHAAVEIPDLKDAVRQALAHTPSGLDPFFSNTARSNAVVFNYDLATATVSADVKVDNSTIVKNKYGQLVAITSEVKAHTHTVEDIIGLNLDELQNMVAAGLQPLGLPPDGSYHDGAHDLEGTTINEAFDIINVDIKELTNNLTEISTDISAIKPVEPPSIEEIELELWKEYELFPAAIAGSGVEVLALFDQSPKTEISSRFAGSLERGTISAIVDGTERNTALKDVTEIDYYAGQPAYQGWYRSLTARIEVQSNLEVGAHTFQLQYSEGEVVKRSKVLNVYIAEARPAAGIDITGSSFQLSKKPAMTSFVSGIPTASNQEYEIGNLDVLNAVGKYYKPKEIASIRGHQPENLVLEEGQTQILVDPANTPAVDGTLQLKNIPITIANEYASPVTFSVACYDIFGNKSTERELGVDQNLRNDPSDESARVQSGSAADIYPTVTPGFCGDPFNSSASLSTGLYYSELQLINNRYRWPSGDFTKFGGPNYENTNGTRLNGAGPDSEEYRWFTLKFEVEDLLAFSMLFKRVDSEWPLTLNLTIPNIKMYGCIVGQTEWVDLNKPFVGYGGVDQIGQGALDVNKTTQDTRRITFGAGVGPYTGDLLIRVGLPKNTEYEIQSDISITPASY